MLIEPRTQPFALGWQPHRPNKKQQRRQFDSKIETFGSCAVQIKNDFFIIGGLLAR